jgi:signal transduction histidine kinase
VNLGAQGLFLLASDTQIAEELRRVVGAREGAGPLVNVVVVEGSTADAVAHVRTEMDGGPLGMVASTDEDAFAAMTAGVDDACLSTELSLHHFVSFLDRVLLRAANRREAENRQAAAAHAEKLAALGTLVAGVAHEINNPLNVVLVTLEMQRSMVEPLLRAQEEIFRLARRGGPASAEEVARLSAMAQTGASPSEVRGMFDDANLGLRMIADIVRDLRIFARADEDEKQEPVFVPDLVDQVLRVIGKQLTTFAELERDYGQDLPALVLPRSRITQVLTNLLINAAQAILEVKRPMHRVRISMRCDAEALALSVSDTGPGIPPDIVERIFDPFFTTKRADRAVGGTGLGLSISRSIMQSLGGDLVVESVHGEGATFIAIIPTEGRRVSHEVRRERRHGMVGGARAKSSVLVVDDEEALLRTIAIALRGRFNVLLAGDGQEAVDLLVSGSRPDAILCDVGMPVVDGPHFYEWLEENRPELAGRTAFITANPDGPAAIALAARTHKPLLEKPVMRDELIAVLDRIVTASA